MYELFIYSMISAGLIFLLICGVCFFHVFKQAKERGKKEIYIPPIVIFSFVSGVGFIS